MKNSEKKSNKFYEEYVLINGLQHYFLHYPTESKYLVLFLHGGPGQSEIYYAYHTVFSNRNYSISFYDQRGAGKTNSKDKTKSKVTFENLLSDLNEIIEYLKTKFPEKQIILLGHSWGSVLGFEYAKLYPQKISAFIGMGQVINFKKGEKIGFDFCYEKATIKDRKKLFALNNYPESITTENVFQKCNKFRLIQMKYGLCGFKDGYLKLLKIALKSPCFSWKDLKSNISLSKKNTLLMNFLINYDTTNFIQSKIPIYFICGENDWQVPSVFVKEYFENLQAPDKNFFLIKNAAHLTDLENPEDYNKALNEICNRLEDLKL